MLSRFIASLIPEYIDALIQNARDEGKRCAFEEIEAKKARYKRWHNSLLDGADPTLYGPKRFLVTTALEVKMRNEVALAVQNGWVNPPTPDQWEMILSDNPATCVVAGAGSGKSTTLILRVVFMICHLKLSPETITVVSFTVKSCEELRDKLADTFQHEQWKSQMPERYADDLEKTCNELVSTFHSALSRVARKEFPGIQWFDMLGNEKGNRRKADKNEDGEEVIDNPFASNGLTNDQLKLIKNAYNQCFVNSEPFRKHVIRLLEISVRQLENPPGRKKEPRATQSKALFAAAQKDLELIRRINKKWEDAKCLPPCIDLGPYLIFKENNLSFYANGRLKESGIPVFLSIDGKMGQDYIFGDHELIGEGTNHPFSIKQAIKQKKYIVDYYFRENCLYISTKEACNLLQQQLKYRDTNSHQSRTAPEFVLKISGELQSADIEQVLYDQGSFIENLGLNVVDACQKLNFFKEGSAEYHFKAVLEQFWPAFTNILDSQTPKMMTFNRAFSLLGDAEIDKPLRVPSSSLSPFTHLLIDEFQDISPQIVTWIKTMQRRLLWSGQSPSVMAIGDDWQSIYGWRGSAPEIFINFGKYFETHPDLGGHKVCRMLENYRSVDKILTDAEMLLKPVSIKIDKAARAKKSAQELDHGVKFIFGSPEADDYKEVRNQIKDQLAFVNGLPKADKTKVIVLSRTRNPKDALNTNSSKDDGVDYLTFHGSKGLQGEVAILIGEPKYEQEHIFRNGVYKISGLFEQSYDDSAKDEVLRLAYVGVTRGIRRVFWFLRKDSPIANLIKGNDKT